MVSDVQQPAEIGDLMKVHDYNYLHRLNELVNSLKGSDNKVLKFIDGQDTAIS